MCFVNPISYHAVNLGPVRHIYVANHSYAHSSGLSSKLNTATKIYFQDHMLPEFSDAFLKKNTSLQLKM